MPLLLTRALRAAVVGFVALLAACSGPPVLPMASPSTETASVHLPRGRAVPVLTATVGGTGTGRPVAPGIVCSLWTWGSDALPALADGLSFRVDHAVVVPDTWVAMSDVCATSAVPSCASAVLTADAPTCSVGFVRSRTASPHAFVGVIGSLLCPAAHRDCVAPARQVDAASDVSSSLDLEALARQDG